MRSQRKSFILAALLLTACSLFLSGCAGGGSEGAPATKPVTGFVSASGTGQALANAKVAVYAITGGVPSATPLATGTSDGLGAFSIAIPQGYEGGVLVEAADGSRTIRAVLPSIASGQTTPPVTVSLTTEILVQYIVQNNGASFTAATVQAATLVLEPVFGPNFTQTPPVAIGIAPTQLQQNLLVATRVFDALVSSGHTIAELVTLNGAGTLGLGTVIAPAELTQAVATVAGDLVVSGMIPGSYPVAAVGSALAANAATPVSQPDLGDQTPPSAPVNLAAATTYNSVALSWAASSDNVGVTSYYIYRDGAFSGVVTPPAALAYTDSSCAASTTYRYEVRARDAAGNISAGVSVTAVTPAKPPVAVYNISGAITLADGSPLAGVLVAITGAGSGVAVTGADGAYLLTGAYAGRYTLTPSLPGDAFAPAGRTITITTTDSTGNNFTATQSGAVTGVGAYPNGVIIGGVTYPTGVVVGGVTYPFATVIGGVTYPTGSVLGGITYPDGVVIGGISYPPGTVVGGVAFPPGVVATGVVAPTGTVMGGITYPNGTVGGGVITPAGTAVGTPAYPSGTVIGGVTVSSGMLVGGVVYPAGTVTGAVAYASGAVTGAVANAGGVVAGTVNYNAIVYGRVTNASGTGLSGVDVVIDNGAGHTTVTTGFDGTYSFIGVLNGSYTVTPSLVTALDTTTVPWTYTYAVFTPASQSITVSSVDSNIHGPDFQAN
jgi:hypothetical protein